MNDDIHTLSGAYAADALDDVERARFERHLASCEDCRAEVASLAAAAAELSALTKLPPPSGLRDRVLRDITSVRPLPPLTPLPTAAQPTADQPSAELPTPAQLPVSGQHADSSPSSVQDLPPRGTHPSRARRWVLAAAAAVVLALGGLGVWASLSPDEARPTQSVAQQVLDAPDATRVAKSFPGGATATLVRSAALGRAVLVTSQMPAAPSGQVYQLWLQDATGHLTSAGLMPAGSDQVVLLQGDASEATGAGISVEPAGGSEQPTTDPIALFPLT